MRTSARPTRRSGPSPCRRGRPKPARSARRESRPSSRAAARSSSMSSSTLTYKKSGVNIDLADKLVDHIAKNAPAIGGFAGLFPLDLDGSGPWELVACTDGVGTKLKLAFALDRHDTIGVDLVAMSVNDLVCCGAKP